MMESFFDFFSFSDPNVRFVVIGSILITASSAIVGSFTFLKKKALVGDAVAHAVLPGVCLSFILYGEKNPIVLILGAFSTGWIALTAIDFISSKSKIKEDTAIGLILSVFFGFGIFLLTIIQKSGNAAQSGLDSFLFGKAASLIGTDVITFSIVAIILLITVSLLFKELTLIAFDKNFAHVLGLPVKALELTLTTLTVLAVVIGIQAVGVVLMAAMLITPAAAARFWTHRIHTMIILAATFGAFSGVSGAYISYLAPAMPTGPWIVIVVSTIAMFSFFFAPKKGIINRVFRQRYIRRKMRDENILKALYHIGEKDKNFYEPIQISQIQKQRIFDEQQLVNGLKNLRREGFINFADNAWYLSKEGKRKGQRVVKIHRLWEVYLTTYLRIAPDHVHEDADTIEHILTPELEERLEKLLKYPTIDPHESEIPYIK